MTAVKSIHSLSNLRYIGIFDYMEDKVFMIRINQAIHTGIVYFRKVI